MAIQVITPEQRVEIDRILDNAAEIRRNLVKGKLAGLVSDAEIEAHDNNVAKLKRIKQQFVENP